LAGEEPMNLVEEMPELTLRMTGRERHPTPLLKPVFSVCSRQDSLP
jgi:hypothetical protein